MAYNFGGQFKLPLSMEARLGDISFDPALLDLTFFFLKNVVYYLRS